MRMLTYLAGGLPGLILAGGVAIIFLYGGQRVITEAITMGTFVAFMAYQMRLLGPIQGLMGLYASLATARVSLGRVHVILDTPVQVRDPERPASAKGLGGELRLEEVSFSFGRAGAVLDGVDLVIREGEVVAVVGASGSGKSTIVDLLSRQLDPDGGRILLGGRDLRTLRLKDVRARVVPVEQQPFLFNATIAENIRYGRPGASDAEVEAAARAVGLDAFLATLPDALETQVGERGGGALGRAAPAGRGRARLPGRPARAGARRTHFVARPGLRTRADGGLPGRDAGPHDHPGLPPARPGPASRPGGGAGARPHRGGGDGRGAAKTAGGVRPAVRGGGGLGGTKPACLEAAPSDVPRVLRAGSRPGVGSSSMGGKRSMREISSLAPGSDEICRPLGEVCLARRPASLRGCHRNPSVSLEHPIY